MLEQGRKQSSGSRNSCTEMLSRPWTARLSDSTRCLVNTVLVSLDETKAPEDGTPSRFPRIPGGRWEQGFQFHQLARLRTRARGVLRVQLETRDPAAPLRRQAPAMVSKPAVLGSQLVWR